TVTVIECISADGWVMDSSHMETWYRDINLTETPLMFLNTTGFRFFDHFTVGLAHQGPILRDFIR
ncbi:hypothetical protein OSI08_27000, partial [Mycobacterium ulcerans]